MAKTQSIHKARPGFIAHTEFVSTDPTATRDFLAEVVGWDFKPYEHPSGSDYQVFSSEHTTGGAVRPTQKGLTVPAAVPFVEVDDLEAAEERIRGAGGRIVVPRLDYGEGRGASLVCQAPGGPLVGLWAPQ